MSRNFSPGDVVVCVDAGGPIGSISGTRLSLGETSGLQRGALYTVTDAFQVDLQAAVSLAEVAPPVSWEAFNSSRFRLAYRPDPEVEREASDLKEPAPRKTHQATGAQRSGANQ